MKKNKFVKFIEIILCCLPLLYVGGVSIYTIFNKNAKDSYYGETINDSEVVYYDSVSNGDNVYVSYTQQQISEAGFLNRIFGATDIDLHGYTFDYGQANTIRFIFSANGSIAAQFYNSSSYISSLSLTANQVELSFTITSISPYSSGVVDIEDITNMFYRIDYNDYSYLNNALPYAMSEFNKLGFNKIPFTQFFVGLFHTGASNVYIDFIDSYLNYFILVECCYVIPMCLYWFIHFGEHLIDKYTRRY